MSIAALVLGIASFFICPLVGSVLAIIFGYIGLKNIRESRGALQGEGFAKGGIILGFINLGVTLVLIIVIVIVAVAANHSSGGSMVAPALAALSPLL